MATGSGSVQTSSWGIIVHGGAGGRVSEDGARGCQVVAEEAAKLLQQGAPALDVVERAVMLLEDNPEFNAGAGAHLTAEGTVELDASIMDGETLAAGAVCALPPFRNPVAIARAVLEEGVHVLYAGDGAVRFAEQAGFQRAASESLITERARSLLAAPPSLDSKPSGGTVGAVAIDAQGRIAAGTSTGGTSGKRPGRVGDSPLIGAGTYADSRAGGASATGHGEGIVRVSLTSNLVSRLRSGESAEAAARIVLDEMMARVGSTGGVVCVDARRHLAFARTTPGLSWAWATADGAQSQGGA